VQLIIYTDKFSLTSVLLRTALVPGDDCIMHYTAAKRGGTDYDHLATRRKHKEVES
jgi:hypothetical protein